MIYHGSQYIIESPEYGKGSPFNDYGLGFYCTEHIELAKEWACTSEHDGYANKYELDMSGLAVMRLNSGEYNILNWLAILLENRRFDVNTELKKNARDYLLTEFLPDYKNADIIIGYRADDSYFSFASAFLANSISLQQLAKAMYPGRLGEQIVIRSQKAFSKLSFAGYEIADRNEYYQKRKSRDDMARQQYRTSVLTGGSPADDTFIVDIIRQKWRNRDVRI